MVDDMFLIERRKKVQGVDVNEHVDYSRKTTLKSRSSGAKVQLPRGFLFDINTDCHLYDFGCPTTGRLP